MKSLDTIRNQVENLVKEKGKEFVLTDSFKDEVEKLSGRRTLVQIQNDFGSKKYVCVQVRSPKLGRWSEVYITRF